MPHCPRRGLLPAATSVALGGLPTWASAQESWPSRPIRFVVPFPPGGGSDTLSRELTGKLAAQKGWTLVIDNKPLATEGAVPMLASREAARDFILAEQRHWGNVVRQSGATAD